MRAAAEHSAALTHDLLSFGRRQLLEPRALSVSEICSSLVRILRPAVGRQIELVVEDEAMPDGAGWRSALQSGPRRTIPRVPAGC